VGLDLVSFLSKLQAFNMALFCQQHQFGQQLNFTNLNILCICMQWLQYFARYLIYSFKHHRNDVFLIYLLYTDMIAKKSPLVILILHEYCFFLHLAKAKTPGELSTIFDFKSKILYIYFTPKYINILIFMYTFCDHYRDTIFVPASH
jgi:hypothetical protein